MKYVHWTLHSFLATAYLGCAGTIDDPASFESAQSPVAQVQTGNVDAGVAQNPGTSQPQTTVMDAGNSAVDAGSGKTNSTDAGSSSTADSGSGKGTVSCDFKALMQSKCGSSGCHGAPATSTGLDLTSADLATRLQGRKASDSCSDYLLIDPDNPEKSALYLMVTPNSCGVRMPIGGSMSAADQACVLSWLQSL